MGFDNWFQEHRLARSMGFDNLISDELKIHSNLQLYKL